MLPVRRAYVDELTSRPASPKPFFRPTVSLDFDGRYPGHADACRKSLENLRAFVERVCAVHQFIRDAIKVEDVEAEMEPGVGVYVEVVLGSDDDAVPNKLFRPGVFDKKFGHLFLWKLFYVLKKRFV